MKLCLAAALVALTSLHSSAQELVGVKEYVLASEDPLMPIGATHQVDDNSNMTNCKLKITVGEQDLGGEMGKNSKEVQIFEYLAGDKIKVTNLKNRAFEKSTIMGQAKAEEEVSAIEGRMVLLKKPGKKWVGKLKGNPVEPIDHENVDDEIKSLVRSLNNSTAESAEIYGTGPHKVGATWEFDPKNVPGMDEFKIVKGAMAMTFVEVKELNWEPCAILKGTFTINGLPTDETMAGLDAKVSGEMRIALSLKYLRDDNIKGDMKVAVSGVMEPRAGVVIDFAMAGDLNAKRLTAVLSPKKGPL
jgi:hypothetical protein